MLSLSLWSFFDFINWNWTQLDHDWVMFIYHIQAPFYLLTGFLFCRFAYSLIGKEKGFFTSQFLIIPAIFSIFSLFTPYITKGYKEVWWGVEHSPGVLFVPGVIICVLIPCQYALILIHKSLKTAQSTSQRKQRSLILVGSYLILYIGMITDILLPHILKFEESMQLAGSTVTILGIFMHRAITKYDLLPINIQDTVDELFDHSRQGVLIINSDKIILEMNPAAAMLLEAPETELINMPITNLIIEDLFESDTHECEILRFSKSGDRYLHISANKHIRKNQLIGWVLILRNITAEKASRKKITEMNQSLEARVKSRTFELEESQEKLIQQTEDLERVSTYKSEFMANMSHEIRTPMNGIVGFTEIMLMEGNLDESQLDALKNVQTCSKSLLELVNDILDFSKIEADCIALEKIHLDLGELISEAADICRTKLDQSNKDVEILLDSTKIKHLVLGDPTRLKQVIMNLISNAVKFTSQGYILATAEVTTETETDLTIKFTIKDTGIGISEEQKSRIFNAFEQADGSTTRKYGGTGLGLSISKRLVQLMGGELDVESKLNDGTEFFFSLDLPKGELLPNQNNTPKNEKIFHLESCPVSREILRKSLKLQAHQITEKDCTLENIKEINEENCSSLFFNTADLDFKRCLSLKKHLDRMERKPRLIAISPAKTATEINKTKKMEAEVHIIKPYYHRKLLRTLYGKKPTEESIVSLTFEINLMILMVEDNLVNQRLQTKLLQNMGHKVDLAEDGAAAVSMGQDSKYDLILMDMQLPIKSGLEATVELRELNIKTPIIALTANAFESDKQSCLESGMDDFLTKPVSSAALHQMIKKHALTQQSV